MRWPGPWRVAGVLMTAGLSACGVPQDGQPRGFADPAEISRFLTEPQAAPTDLRRDDTLATEAASIWLIRGDRLVERPRSVSELRVDDVVTQLLAGPTDAELDAGFRSALSPGARLRQVRYESADVVTIDIGTPFTDVRLTYEQISAIGQLVFTATAVPGVEAVRLALDGEIVRVSTEVGELTRDPVGRADYDGLLGQEKEVG